MVHRLCCSVACGIISDEGSNPGLLHQQADSLPLSHQGSPPPSLYTCAHRICTHVPNQLVIYLLRQIQRSLPPSLLILTFVTYLHVSCISPYVLPSRRYLMSLETKIFENFVSCYLFTTHSFKLFCCHLCPWGYLDEMSSVPSLKKLTEMRRDQHMRTGNSVERAIIRHRWGRKKEGVCVLVFLTLAVGRNDKMSKGHLVNTGQLMEVCVSLVSFYRGYPGLHI